MVACSPFGPAGEFAASRHGALTRSQAASFGLSSKAIRRLLRDQLSTARPGVLVIVGSPPTSAPAAVRRHAWRRRVPALPARAPWQPCTDRTATNPGLCELLLPSGRHLDIPGVVMRTGSARTMRHRRRRWHSLPPESLGTLCDLASIESPGRGQAGVRVGVANWLEPHVDRADRRASRLLAPARTAADPVAGREGSAARTTDGVGARGERRGGHRVVARPGASVRGQA